jgi:DNA-binding MarR family transcriptional regulator
LKAVNYLCYLTIGALEVKAQLEYHVGMRANDSPKKAAIAAGAWRRMFDFFIATRAQRDCALERFGLTPGDSKALLVLDADQGRSMHSLAESWLCDASNATWVVDRLEQRGLVERRTAAGDRRVKTVLLTPLGAKTKAELLAALYEPPPELLGLSLSDLEALRDAVAKLPPPAHLAALPEPAPPQATPRPSSTVATLS